MATGKRRQTFEKMNRERKVREKRALKAAKREQRKLDAHAIASGDGATEVPVVRDDRDDASR